MNELIRFIREFIQNKGLFVFSAIFVGKISVFLTHVIAGRLLSKDEYGLIVLVLSVFAVFSTLSGMGSNQGLLRFGVLQKNDEDKDKLSAFVLRQGFVNHIFVTICFLIVGYLYVIKYQGIGLVIAFFGIRMIGGYFENYIQSYYRIFKDNKTFSILNITVSVAGLLMVAVGTYFFGIIGYLAGIALMPWFSLLYFKKPKKTQNFKSMNLNLKEFWSYSIHASLTYFFSDLLFSMDFMLIGIMLDESSVAVYKAAVILPMNLAILPLIFMQTDYPKLAENYKNKNYLKFYIRNYYKIFIPLGILCLVVGYFIKNYIVQLIYGDQYAGNGWVFFIILAAIVGNMCMRNLYGNLSAAIGKAHWNSYASLIAIGIVIGVSVWLIPIYGIMGAAIGMTAAFLFTGLFTMTLFNLYLKKLDDGKN